ncbi:hypothetical protein AB0I81_45075 [Nonomuraea sp. NPDC050404]|uniref:hypothetical protein n=1 Tax=Nonomuraea sp. NPDC050404 TaxID=3155783 RepID=UPI0033F6E168
MTRYAIDRARNTLTAQWGTGIGDLATTVAELPGRFPYHDVLRLADLLTRLSQTCWRCYTHPAGAADAHGPGSIGWHRLRERDAFAAVLTTLAAPDRRATDPTSEQPCSEPPGNGPPASESPTPRPPASAPPADGPPADGPPADGPATKVGNAAHAVGSALRALGSTRLTEYVTTDVTAELAAIEQAERGDLTERAQQAVTLTREDASPLQIAQADILLRHDPLAAEALITQIDPTAAAIAAAHWLYAAVAVTARHTGTHPVQVVVAADQRTKPLATESLTDVIAVIGAGGRPRHVVMTLIRNALHIAEGHLYGITDARHRITAAEQLIDQAQADHPGLDLGPDTVHLPLTSLDPARPAPDLLENLLHGIRSCHRFFERHGNHRTDDPQREGPHEAFLRAIRYEAASRNEHLL